MSDKSRSRAGQRERTFGRRWKPSLPDLRRGLKRRSRERSVVWPPSAWPRSVDRYRLAVPNSRKRFGRIVLAVTLFRELTGLNDSLGYIRGHGSLCAPVHSGPEAQPHGCPLMLPDV